MRLAEDLHALRKDLVPTKGKKRGGGGGGVSAEYERELRRLQDRLIDFETRMLRRIDYVQDADRARDVRLKRMEGLLQRLVQQAHGSSGTSSPVRPDKVTRAHEP